LALILVQPGKLQRQTGGAFHGSCLFQEIRHKLATATLGISTYKQWKVNADIYLSFPMIFSDTPKSPQLYFLFLFRIDEITSAPAATVVDVDVYGK
jgi:hypothetical protein